MNAQKYATIFPRSDVDSALRPKVAALNYLNLSTFNDPAKVASLEDAEDLPVFSERKIDKSVLFDSFVQRLQRRGRI